MKIVTWNVNSINARLEHVKRFLQEDAPDILMVQELKGLEFPEAEFAALGYQTESVRQKAYNGVAVFSKTPIITFHKKLPGDETDEQARFIEFETAGHHLINIYLPNGNPLGTEKFIYKLNWMKRLYTHLKTLREENIPFIIGGDFNIIPEDKDCYDPNAWKDDALFQPESRAALRALTHLGLTDAFRIFDPRSQQYTFWDYQAGAWQNDKGIRIDHFLLSPEYTDKIHSCRINKTPRGWDKPSDHTPVILEIK